MTEEQSLTLIAGITGLIVTYIAIKKPDLFTKSAKGRMWVKLIGLKATRIVVALMGITFIVFSVFGFLFKL